jgi:hypothetical protein
MVDDASHGASSSTVKPADDPESTIEINIKTLDSQVHKLRVEKNVRILLPPSHFCCVCLSAYLLLNSVWSARSYIHDSALICDPFS